MTGKKGMRSTLITQPCEVTEYRPGWLGSVDRRTALYRALRARLEELYDSLGGYSNVSVQQEMVCERIVFLELQLREMERSALDGDAPLDTGKYGYLSNTLTGLLMKLGLSRPSKSCPDGMAEAWGRALRTDADISTSDRSDVPLALPYKPR